MVPFRLDPFLDLQSSFLYASRLFQERRQAPASAATGAAAAGAMSVIGGGLRERFEIHVGCMKEVVLNTDASSPDKLAFEGMARELLERPSYDGLRALYQRALRLIPAKAEGSMPFSLRLYAAPVVLHDGRKMAFSLAMKGYGVSGIGTSLRAHRVGLLLLLDLSGSMNDLCGGAATGGMPSSRFSRGAPPSSLTDSCQSVEVITKRVLAIRSAQQLIKSLPDGSPVQVIGYHNEAREFFRGTPQDLRDQSLESRIDSGFSGGTRLVSTVDLIAADFFATCVPHSISVLVVTDGLDFSNDDAAAVPVRGGFARGAGAGGAAAASAMPAVAGVSVADPGLNLGQGIRRRIVEKLGGSDALQQTYNSVRVISLGIGQGYNEAFLRGLSGGFLSGLADTRQMAQTLEGFRSLMGPRESFWACVTLSQREAGRWRCLGVLTDGFSQSENAARINVLVNGLVAGRRIFPAGPLSIIASYLDNQGTATGVPKFYSLVPGVGDRCQLTSRTPIVEELSPRDSDASSVQLAPVVLRGAERVRLMVSAGRGSAAAGAVDPSEIPEGGLMAMLHMANHVGTGGGVSSTSLSFSTDPVGKSRTIIDAYRKALNEIYYSADERTRKEELLNFYETKISEIRASLDSAMHGSVEELLQQLRAYRTALETNNEAVLQQYQARASAHAYAGHRTGLTK